MTEDLVCQTCGLRWTRTVTKGRKPRLCSECKDDPSQVKKKEVLDEEAKRAAAIARVQGLEEALEARGNHIGQQDKLSTLQIQINELEKRVETLESNRKRKSVR